MNLIVFDWAMRLSGRRRFVDQLEDCLIFDSSVTEIQPGETVPLLSHSSTLPRHSFEMAPVHMSSRQDASLLVNFKANPPDGRSSGFSCLQTLARGRFCIVILLICYISYFFCSGFQTF